VPEGRMRSRGLRSKVQGRQGMEILTKKIIYFQNSFYNPTASSDTDEKISVQKIPYIFLRFCPSL